MNSRSQTPVASTIVLDIHKVKSSYCPRSTKPILERTECSLTKQNECDPILRILLLREQVLGEHLNEKTACLNNFNFSLAFAL